MNNNKKYKKWSLGLVAPALVLAPIAVVASCSSSGEEKEVYSVSFKQSTLSAEVSNKNIKPSKLSREGFVQEIINNKTNIFNIDDSSGKVTDDFLKENLVVGEITADDTKKTASAGVTLNNKNTDGGSEDATITLTGFDYKEVDLSKLTYTIEFKSKDNDPQTINLEKSDTSLDGIDELALVRLVLEEKIKEQILTITGTNAKDITNEVLENQILEVPKDSINKNQQQGEVQFKLKVLNDGTSSDSDSPTEIEKDIIFTGFKSETDDTPTSPKYKITLKETTPKKEYEFSGLENTLASSLSTGDEIRDLILKNKETMFELSGDYPTEDKWWKEKLSITTPSQDDDWGKVKFNLVLNDSNTIDESTDSDGIKINETNVVIKGFKIKTETTLKTEISSVALGLNGNLDEIKQEVNAKWINEKKAILFEKGFQAITEDGITNVTHEAISNEATSFNLKFKLAANKHYDQNGELVQSEKDFTIKVKDISDTATTGTTLKVKSTNPVSIGLIDPILAQGTYEEFKNNSANIFTKEFVFKYQKHLLTGDFSLIKNAEDLVKDGVKVIPNDTGSKIEIQFKIPKEKVLPASQSDDISISIEFTGFATN